MNDPRISIDDETPVADPRLKRTDWITAALTLFMDEGIDAVRITRLAEALTVTRGSFYWHFRDRADLCDAIMAHWERTNTSAVLSAVTETESLAHGILKLFDAWLDTTRFDPRLDSAMRDWARRSDDVRDAVNRADDARIAAIADMYGRHGFGDPDAFIRARILYFTQIGYYALGIDETMVQRFGYLEAYYRGFTGEEIDPVLAHDFREKYTAEAQS